MDQSANKLALVEPSNFNFNIQTFDTNIFQNDVQFNKLKIFEEFDNFISTLDKNKISFNILKSPKNSPDSIYPNNWVVTCLLYTSPSPRDVSTSRMPSSA